MKRICLLAGLFVLGGLVLWFGFRRGGPISAPPSGDPSARPAAIRADVTVEESARPTESTRTSAAPLIGELLLAGYADPAQPAPHDLTLMSRLMDNFLLLVKDAADRPLSANEDWAAAFRGANPAQERYLPDDHAALNEKGQLVDRWGTPLFFHVLEAGRFEIRSAGPDQALWTADDIHRNADGTFRRGEDLLETTLLSADAWMP